MLVNGYDYQQNWNQTRRVVGYVGERDTLWQDLSVEQHLRIYAELRGVKNVSNAVDFKIHQLQLQEWRSTQAKDLSAGARRKLQWGISLIGEPNNVFIDQPTRGMDPLTRRFMMGLMRSMAAMRSDGCFVVATDLMDEASTVSDRIAIQVDGSFRCFGTADHILRTHGQGFELNINFEEPPELRDVSQSQFKPDRRDSVAMWNARKSLQLEGKLRELLGEGGFIRAEVDSLKATWIFHAEGELLSDVFQYIEDISHDCSIDSYTISRVNLERVFHYFSLQKCAFDSD